ncbi:MAG: hypothetical protein AMXMBFR84_06990 [Candidatus Hydrogenedentota bacterium]
MPKTHTTKYDVAEHLLCIGKAGLHVKTAKGDQPSTICSCRRTTVPVHQGQDIGRGLLRKILREIEITPEEFARLL